MTSNFGVKTPQLYALKEDSFGILQTQMFKKKRNLFIIVFELNKK